MISLHNDSFDRIESYYNANVNWKLYLCNNNNSITNVS